MRTVNMAIWLFGSQRRPEWFRVHFHPGRPTLEMLRCCSSVLHFVNSRQYLGGLVSGLLVAILFIQYQLHQCTAKDCPSFAKALIGDTIPNTWSQHFYKEAQNVQQLPPVTSVSSTEDVPTEKLERRDRILCWVVTAPQNKFRAQMVRDTWGRRCDKLLFMSSKNDSSLPAIGLPLPGPESRDQLWNKAKLTFRYVYNNHLNDYDWFFKADDDTYAIMENMRHYLSALNQSDALFLGRRFQRFLSGGPGYILTRETLRRLVEKGLEQKVCNSTQPGEYDDVSIAECLQYLNVTFADTRDLWGHQRFIPYNVEEFYSNTGANMNFIHGADYYPFEKGYNCCSTQAISFHYVSGYRMQMYEYLLYQLKIFNKSNNTYS